jgi:arsenate reductase-like glutaredoxin family protein
MDKEILKRLQEATDKARERVMSSNSPFAQLEKLGGKRDPAGHYVALAYTYNVVQMWLNENGIEQRAVKYISDPRDVRGAGYDLIAVCFPDWGERQLRDTQFRDAVTVLQSRTIAYRYVDVMKPFTDKGRIIGWIPKSNSQTSSPTSSQK